LPRPQKFRILSVEKGVSESRNVRDCVTGRGPGHLRKAQVSPRNELRTSARLMLGRGGSEGGGVVDDDAPAVGEFAEVERENAGRMVFLTLEMILADDDGGAGAILLNFEIRKCEMAHGFAIGIGAMVTVENGLPAARDAIGTDEESLVGPPVTIHEGVDVAAIPGGHLRAEDSANLRFGRGLADSAGMGGTGAIRRWGGRRSIGAAFGGAWFGGARADARAG